MNNRSAQVGRLLFHTDENCSGWRVGGTEDMKPWQAATVRAWSQDLPLPLVSYALDPTLPLVPSGACPAHDEGIFIMLLAFH